MADQPAQRNLAQPSLGPIPGEPAGRRYALTTGPVAPQRPGNLPGSTSGGRGDTGRTGVARLLDDKDLDLLPPHTGY